MTTRDTPVFRITGTLSALLVCLLAPGLSAQTAEDAAAACEEAVRLIGEGDTDGALEEAQWCVESLEQVRQAGTLAVFPDTVGDYAAGEIDNQSAMGMTIISRDYEGDAGRIAVSLTTGSAGSGLAALAQMGMSMGAGTGKKLRIQKRTVLDMSEAEGQSQFMVQLKSGGMLNVESGSVAPDDVLSFLKAFPIEQLDDALAR